MTPQKKKLTYSAAIEELREILESLEEGEVDVDTLSPRVKRAVELISFCRKQLRETEMEVTQAVESLQDDEKVAEESASADGPDEGADSADDELPF